MKAEVLKGYAQSRQLTSRVRLALYHALLLGRGVRVLVRADDARASCRRRSRRTRAFFFGKPLEVLKVIWEWFTERQDLSASRASRWSRRCSPSPSAACSGSCVGLWLALSPIASALADPYIKAMNAMPRVILAPIFAVWFGLGITSKVALGVTLVFFIVFFNVYQGVKEVSPAVLANARMLGASKRQLLRYIYLPSATSWVFSSLHTSVGMAFVGAVVGEYLGSAKGVGYLILQAEGVFDINTVFAGILVLTVFALVLDFIVTRIESAAARLAAEDRGDGGDVAAG